MQTGCGMLVWQGDQVELRQAWTLDGSGYIICVATCFCNAIAVCTFLDSALCMLCVHQCTVRNALLWVPPAMSAMLGGETEELCYQKLCKHSSRYAVMRNLICFACRRYLT